MKRRSPWLLVLFLAAFALIACNLVNQLQRNNRDNPTLPTTTIEQENLPAQAPTEAATKPSSQLPAEATDILPVETSPATQGEHPFPGGKPPQSQAAEIRPPDMRTELTRLSTWMGMEVTGLDSVPLGTATDYIINTCETYVVYFTIAPAESFGMGNEDEWIIPYEVVTINSGALDAEKPAISLYLHPEQLANAPAFPASLPLFPTTWEDPVRAYWSEAARISNLTTECRVAGGSTVVQKNAYASRLMGAPLKDGLQNQLGTVEEAILAPESGKLAFFVVNLEGDQGLVLVPLRVVNIPQEALSPEAELSLVLLTENEVLLNAPRISTLEEATSDAAQGSAIQHWNR